MEYIFVKDIKISLVFEWAAISGCVCVPSWLNLICSATALLIITWWMKSLRWWMSRDRYQSHETKNFRFQVSAGLASWQPRLVEGHLALTTNISHLSIFFPLSSSATRSSAYCELLTMTITMTMTMTILIKWRQAWQRKLSAGDLITLRTQGTLHKQRYVTDSAHFVILSRPGEDDWGKYLVCGKEEE